MNPLHSIVVPVYKSKDILENLVVRLADVMRSNDIQFELILVDDGSNDGSYEEIVRLAKSHDFIRGFKLSRNFGHQAALTVGLKESKGCTISIIDDDLQDPPEVLPSFIAELDSGYDVIYGIRRARKEGVLHRIMYSMFYRILNWSAKLRIPHDSGDFCVMRRCVVEALVALYDANPFLRGCRAWVGFRQKGVEYERAERFCGDSGYSFRQYCRLAVTGILMFSYVPLRMATIIGFSASVLGFGYAVFIIGYWLIRPFDVPGYLSLMVMITFMGGVQLLSIGIMGEYLARLNDNARRWPVAFVAEQTENEAV